MKDNHRVFHTGFGDQAFEIECNNADAYDLAAFLFADLPGSRTSKQTIHYDILSVGPLPMLSLWQGEKRLYFGDSRYQLAYILMNEVTFHCINRNDKQHALHAGAICHGDCCLILPGRSGSGKSTLTAWAIANGYQYLTDELVFIADDGLVSPLTRPISLKGNVKNETWLLSENGDCRVISCDSGAVIPHRLLNPIFSSKPSYVTHIVFPEFRLGAELALTELSPAKSCLHLLQSHVNARNLNGHGVSELAAIARKCRSFQLTYGSCADLKQVFCSASSPFR